MNQQAQLRVNGQRLWDSIMAIAEIGPGQHGGSCRLALTDEDREGRDLFIDWCREIGCSIEIDDMGNIFARRDGRNNDLAPIVAGSHLDTQPHGGKFDGIYGVLAGLEVLRSLHDNNVTTEAPVEVVVWTNEEGSRFAPAMIASGVYAGLFEKDYAWSRSDSDGNTIGAELKRIGYLGDAVCGEHPIGALLEAHIEQGPILEAQQNQVGVVIGGQGQRWYDLRLKGQDSHAGSTPMRGRRDALVAAAEIISMVQTLAMDFAPQAVTTVGEMSVHPNSRNTIPGEVFLTIDIRNPDEAALAEMARELRTCVIDCADKNQVECDLDEIWEKPPVKFDPDCIAAVESATKALGYSHQQIVSGAGHDACQVCLVAPTSMIFVPCAGGLSHNEQESAEPADLEAGCNVLLHAMLNLANRAQA
ncbi:MAG: Zn-dependent hydrolase [Gammaproteobacteria bacterium]|nr:Zn-dependent hydrolase [Gammaproteobacteria bacterium]